MPVQINEVIIRAIITGNDTGQQQQHENSTAENMANVSKEEMLELIDEVINDKKER